VVVWRAGHTVVAIVFLAAIGYVWWCALSGRRGPLLRPAIAALIGEGVVVAANRGDCPLGAVGERIGDTVPLFELVLPPRAARRAVPTLGVLTAVGLVLLVARSRGEHARAKCPSSEAMNPGLFLGLSSQPCPTTSDRSVR
jgi:hypothetical protein